MKSELMLRRRAQAVYIGDGTVLARVFGTLKIFLKTTDLGFGCHVMLDGYWEMWLTQFLARHIQPGMTVVDVGANFGYYTLLFADLVGPAGHVVAVEPAPETVALLRKSVELNGFAARTNVVGCAVGASQHGTGLLYVPALEPKNATLVSEQGIPGGATVEVELTSLDFVTRNLSRVDLVKIDAEGGEASIIAGMAELIARFRPAIVLEYNPSRYTNPLALLDVMTSVYGAPRQIGFDGELHEVDLDSVVDQTNLEDRLLFFSPRT